MGLAVIEGRLRKDKGETEGGRAALNAEPLLYWRGEEILCEVTGMNVYF